MPNKGMQGIQAVQNLKERTHYPKKARRTTQCVGQEPSKLARTLYQSGEDIPQKAG